MRLRVDEVPSLVSFERQTLFSPGIHGPAPPRDFSKVPAHCGQITGRCQHSTMGAAAIRRRLLGPQLVLFGREAKTLVVVRSLSAKSRWRPGPFVARSAPTRILWQAWPEISRSRLRPPEYGGRSSDPNQGPHGSSDLATNFPTAKRQKFRALP